MDLSFSEESCKFFPLYFSTDISTSPPLANYSALLRQTAEQIIFSHSAQVQAHHHQDEAFKTNLLLSPITLALLAVKISLFALAQYFSRDSNFNKIPGPKGIWPVGSSYKLWNQKSRLNALTSWALKYKPCCAFKVGTHNFVLLTTTSAVQKLFSSSDSAYLNKGYAYDVFTPFWKDGLVKTNVEKWRERRKILAKAFTVRSFVGYMDVYNAQSRSLVEGLAKQFEGQLETRVEGSKGQRIDTIVWNHTLRVICEATMGTDIWGIGGIDPFLSSLGTCKDLCMMRIVQPWLMNDWLWSWHPKSHLLRNSVATLHKFTDKVIEQRKQKIAESPPQPSFEDDDDSYTPGIKTQFKSIIEELLLAGIDDEGVNEEVNTFITAGFESTATTLQFLLFCLASNPKHQEMCRAEADGVFNDISLCPDGDLLYDSLANLKYLERCIFETLRLFPVAPLFFRRLDAPLEIDENIELPVGASVGVFSPGLHRDPNYFPNPDHFDPDRFLPENVRDRGQYAFLSFSTGPRNCIGYKFGVNEIKVMTARILRHFTIETSDTVDSVRLYPDIVLTPERGYYFILTTRQ